MAYTFGTKAPPEHAIANEFPGIINDGLMLEIPVTKGASTEPSELEANFGNESIASHLDFVLRSETIRALFVLWMRSFVIPDYDRVVCTAKNFIW
jgi:hypothetical protein